MSAEYKIKAVENPATVLKIDGRCYAIRDAGLPGAYQTTLEQLNIGGSYNTCAECQATGNVPATCPCSATWGTFPCGGEGENIMGLYTANISDVVLSGSYTAVSTDLDVLDEWDATGQPACLWFGNVATAYTKRIAGTTIGVYNSYLGLVHSQYWVLSFATNYGANTTYGAWVKRDGDNPEGTYEAVPNLTTFIEYNGGATRTSKLLSPSTIEVTLP